MLVYKTDDYKLVRVVSVEPFCFWSTVLHFVSIGCFCVDAFVQYID